ncbi:MAG: hypothetical protein O7H41_03450 [Planctomycetota bacterium]|nr:hypothetical protein [Planctomycetota bacterium]
MRTPIPLHLPPGAESYGNLYSDFAADDRTQDVLAVNLPSGHTIDVGWYPEDDPDGSFVIRVFFGTWEDQRHDEFLTKDVNEAAEAVERLAILFSPASFATSATTGDEANMRNQEPVAV